MRSNEYQLDPATVTQLVHEFSGHNRLWNGRWNRFHLLLIFGVAATTSDTKTVLIAGASCATAAAVSMMAGAYLDVETTRDESDATRSSLYAATGSTMALSDRLAKAGLTSEQSNALTVAVQNDPNAINGLVAALDGAPKRTLDPLEQALWMLFADFLAAVPILPFVFLPIFQARLSPGQSR
jgi:VIT1/CCC1 family predicted Fe2+/Mn2+ transporter